MPTANFRPNTYPRGWFCLGEASDLKAGEIREIEAFGSRLVYYRDNEDKLHCLDAYCPHMGASLGQGFLEGSGIRCPFHHWRWEGDGRCSDIPYAKDIPARARISAWPIKEVNKLLFIWYDPEQTTKPEYEIPVIEDCYSDEWTQWRLIKLEVEAYWKEIVDNVADKAHFGPVHLAPISTFSTEFTDHTAVQVTRTESEILGSLDFVATYYGPAYQIGEYSSNFKGQKLRARMLNSHIPIDENKFHLTFGVMVKKSDITTTDHQAFLNDYAERSLETFMQDVRIWERKKYEPNPILCSGDGPLHQLRKWYSQFYQPRLIKTQGVS